MRNVDELPAVVKETLVLIAREIEASLSLS